MKNPIFKVVVNAFTKQAEISTKIKGVEYEITKFFDEIDEWQSFKIDKKEYDIHFHYDEKFSVSIYPVQNGSAQTSNSCKVNLKITIKD